MSYPKENVNLALKDLSKGLRISEVTNKYNVPESIIRAKRKGTYADKKPGPATVLSVKEEEELVQWITESCNKGFPVTKLQLLESVKNICSRLRRKNPFTKNTPGRAWYEGFMKRHPEISRRVSENISLNQAKVTEYSVRQWFAEVKDYLDDKNLINIWPDRIFNCDETGE